jgi:hypothetical protein
VDLHKAGVKDEEGEIRSTFHRVSLKWHYVGCGHGPPQRWLPGRQQLSVLGNALVSRATSLPFSYLCTFGEWLFHCTKQILTWNCRTIHCKYAVTVSFRNTCSRCMRPSMTRGRQVEDCRAWSPGDLPGRSVVTGSSKSSGSPWFGLDGDNLYSDQDRWPQLSW